MLKIMIYKLKRLWNKCIGSVDNKTPCFFCQGKVHSVGPLGPLGSLGSDFVDIRTYACDGCEAIYTCDYDILPGYNDQIEYMNRKH